MIESTTLFLALVGGIVPAVLWLLFWLREDKRRPEPRGLVILTFFGGMVAVLVAIALSHLSLEGLQRLGIIETREWAFFIVFLVLATIEELLKFLAVYITALRNKAVDEPIDALIYMMTGALGFVALENTLFILELLIDKNIIGSIITGNMRFVGASLLHTISSAAIGVAMALAFYQSKLIKNTALIIGIIVAIALHTLFNLSIMNESDSFTVGAFGFVWIAIVILMLLFEKVKKVYAVNKM